MILYELPSLETVYIGAKSCTSCSLTVMSNPVLKSILIGTKSFKNGQLKLGQCNP